MVEMDDLLSGGNGNDELTSRNDADKFECSDSNDN
jgi:Ca2+-binding RTX toxin-like protein